MKKLYTFITSTLLAALTATAAVTVPYSSPIAVAKGQFDEGWTVNNANGDINVNNNEPRTWAAIAENGGSSSFMAVYTYGYSTPADDYLISPAISLKTGKDYILKFKLKTKADKENLTVYLSKSTEPEEILAGKVLFDWADKSDQTLTEYTADISVEEDGDYYISWYAHSPKNKNKIYVCDMEVIANEFTPAAVTDFTATPAPFRETRCDLKWTLPTKSLLGDPFTEDQKIDLIELYRDESETPFATLTEAVSEFSDTEATGLEPGRHTYSIVVTVAGVKSAMVTTDLTPYIGPYLPTPIPCSFTIDNQDTFDMFTVVNGENTDVTTTNQWHFYSGYAGKYAVHSRSFSNKQEDSWLITPPVKADAAGYYRLTLAAAVSSLSNAQKLDIYVGQSANPAEMTLLSDQFKITSTSQSEYNLDFYANEAGTYYFALHAACVGSSSLYALDYKIYGFSVSESAMIPAAVSELKAVAATDESLNIIVSWINPLKDFAGGDITTADYSVKVYVDGAETPAATLSGEELVTEGRQTITLPVDQSGVHTVTVTTEGSDPEAEGPVHPTATTDWVGSKTLAMPYNTTFAKEDGTRAIWSVVDANDDDKTFALGNNGYAVDQPQKGDDGLYHYEDYLLSPKFDLTPGFYALNYIVTGGDDRYAYPNYQPNTKFNYHVALAKSGEVNAESQTFVQQSEDLFVATESESRAPKCEEIFEVKEAGSYQVVFAADMANPEISSSTKYFTVRNVSFEAKPVIPAAVSDLTITPDENKAREALIEWTNPTGTNIEGHSLSEGQITKAVIYRNSEAIGEVTEGLVPGQKSSYLDTTIPDAGEYVYAVAIYSADGAIENPEGVKSTWIGAGMNLPVSFTTDNFNMWKLVDANNDYQSFTGYNAWTLATSGLNINSSSNDTDDWAISPCIEFYEDYRYKLSIQSHFSWTTTADYTFDVYLTDSDDHTAITDEQLIQTIELGTDHKSSNPQLDEIYLSTATETMLMYSRAEASELPVSAGTKYIAIHANKKGNIYLKSVGVDIDQKITGIDDITSNEGIIVTPDGIVFDGEAFVEIYTLTGTLVESTSATDTYSLESLTSGVFIARITIGNKIFTTKIIK